MKNALFIILIPICLSNCNTQNAIDYFNTAVELENKDNYKEAIIQLNKAVILNPKFEKAYLNRAINKSIIGEYESAIDDLNAMINLNKNAIEPYVWRAEYKRMLEQYEEAMKDVEKALELKNPIYEGGNIIGPKEFDINKLYPQGSNFNIELEFIVFERAASNYHLGNYKQALNDIKFCEQPETEPLNTHYYKGFILIEHERYEEACEELFKARKSGEYVTNEVLNEYCKE